jgi:chorismate synthase
VSLSRQENAPLTIVGRHDPCIVPRAVPVVEAAAAVAVVDALLCDGFSLRPDVR